MSVDWSKVAFKGEKRFLSNMYKSSFIFNQNFGFDFIPDNRLYKSSEHLYQAFKSTNLEYQELIRNLDEPKDTKKISDALIGTKYPLRDDWEEIKLPLMHMALLLKFTQNKELAHKLLATKGHIEEQNSWGDTFWGTCEQVGANHLGRLLMEVREYLKNLL